MSGETSTSNGRPVGAPSVVITTDKSGKLVHQPSDVELKDGLRSERVAVRLDNDGNVHVVFEKPVLSKVEPFRRRCQVQVIMTDSIKVGCDGSNCELVDWTLNDVTHYFCVRIG